MKRRDFVKDSVFAGMAMTVPGRVGGISSRQSSYVKIIPDTNLPQLQFLSIDSLGKDDLFENVLLKEAFDHGTNNRWKIDISKKSFTLISEYQPGDTQPFIIKINQHINHATLLGRMTRDNDEIDLPAVMHFPDKGSFRVTSNISAQSVHADAMRFIDEPYVRFIFPPATPEAKKVMYHFEVVAIHPDLRHAGHERYDCFKRNFISIFQLNPLLKILANNTASDACAFTLYKYAEVALFCPPLAPGLTALDLIRDTLDRYLAGEKGYGMLGYDYGKTWDIPESATSCNSLDTYPSLLIAACNYTNGSRDKKWFDANYKTIRLWAAKMLATDADADGLIEFCLSGNSGSWKGDKTQRPANWWDTLGFAHKDAYSNALAYRALILLQDLNTRFGNRDEADYFASKALQLKNAYTRTFLNPATGVLAGWKSADGMLHDYYFTFVSGVAICYGLIDTETAHGIMDKLLLKMKEVGYQDFALGLPGNLIPVIRADYTDLLPEVGGGIRKDNVDGFQIYENGGATACFTYFTIHALQKLGRNEDAEMILLPLLKSMSDGNFQGKDANGKTKDWKSWSGECWGYEGFLVDNYMFLLALVSH